MVCLCEGNKLNFVWFQNVLLLVLVIRKNNFVFIYINLRLVSNWWLVTTSRVNILSYK